MVVKVLRDESQGPMRGVVQVLQSDGEDDRWDVDCDQFTIIGPIVWIQPMGFPPS